MSVKCANFVNESGEVFAPAASLPFPLPPPSSSSLAVESQKIRAIKNFKENTKHNQREKILELEFCRKVIGRTFPLSTDYSGTFRVIRVFLLPFIKRGVSTECRVLESCHCPDMRLTVGARMYQKDRVTNFVWLQPGEAFCTVTAEHGSHFQGSQK